MNDADRLTQLEERYLHLHLHVMQQDKVVLELTEEMNRLRAEIRLLRALLAAGDADEPSNERPPHF
jgi:hypothetical protein